EGVGIIGIDRPVFFRGIGFLSVMLRLLPFLQRLRHVTIRTFKECSMSPLGMVPNLDWFAPHIYHGLNIRGIDTTLCLFLGLRGQLLVPFNPALTTFFKICFHRFPPLRCSTSDRSLGEMPHLNWQDISSRSPRSKCPAGPLFCPGPLPRVAEVLHELPEIVSKPPGFRLD